MYLITLTRVLKNGQVFPHDRGKLASIALYVYVVRLLCILRTEFKIIFEWYLLCKATFFIQIGYFLQTQRASHFVNVSLQWFVFFMQSSQSF